VTEPIISQRVVDQTIRLREGEASILGGIQNNQEQNNWNGIPGLSAIPILKYVFGSRDRIIQDDDIVFVVVPHIVRSQELDEANLRVIDTGEGQSIDLRRADDGTVPAPAAAPQPTALERPSVGTVPGQSAIEAAPQMLAQLRTDMGSNTGPTSAAQAAATTPNSAVAASQAAIAAPSSPPAATTPAPSPPGPRQPPAAATGQTAPPTMGATPATSVGFALNVPDGAVAPGSSFQVPIVLNGGTDVASIAMQMHYDPAKLTLVNVSPGNFLSRDGQAAPPIHTDEPAGNLIIGTSRPPGTHGINGTGVVCVLTFQAKASGTSDLSIARASVMSSAQQQLPAQNAQASVQVK
jgi:general secretion pathway protein D